MDWIDEEEGPMGPFEGALVVLNVGEEEELTESMKPLKEAYDDALSKGWVIVHSFEKGIEPPPWFFGQVEGHNLLCLPQRLGRKDFDFSLLPTDRAAEFSEIGEALVEGNDICFTRKNIEVKVTGRCRIDGSEVVLPPFGP